MNNSRFLFLPPLLVSILLFTLSNLKFGLFLNNSASLLLTPLVKPVQSSRLLLQSKINELKILPVVNRQNREQKLLIASLIWENENLKQAIKDTKIQQTVQSNYKNVVPIKVSNITGRVIATSSFPLSDVKPGMPVVSGNILLGLVTEINNNSLSIISLEDDLFPQLLLRSASGPKGVFRHTGGTSQIVNVPSQTPLILGDFVLTEVTDLIPGNLLVGKITKLLTTPQEPIQKGEIALYDIFQNAPENIVVITKP